MNGLLTAAALVRPLSHGCILKLRVPQLLIRSLKTKVDAGKLKKIPSSLVFPKFEIFQLQTMYEPMVTACLVGFFTSSSPLYSWLAMIWFVGLNAYVTSVCYKVYMFKNKGALVWTAHPITARGFLDKHVKTPLSVVKNRALGRENPEGYMMKGEWSPGDDSEETAKFIGGMRANESLPSH